MATASILQWVPDSLYNLSVSATVCNYHTCLAEVKSLPDSVQFDILYKVRHSYIEVVRVPTVGTRTGVPSVETPIRVLSVDTITCLPTKRLYPLLLYYPKINPFDS